MSRELTRVKQDIKQLNQRVEVIEEIVIKEDTRTPITCDKCQNFWKTKSDKILVTCPNCGQKVKNPMHNTQK